MDYYTGQAFDSLTEKQKENDDVLINEINNIIGELVYDKDHLRKAYNYYNGVYDEDQFKFLEDQYGIGTPTNLEFIPLVRSHIDALIGEHLMNEPQPAITCKDPETLSQINKDKQLRIYEEEVHRIKSQLNDTLFSFLGGADSSENTASEKVLQKLREDAERDFISDFEIAAFYVLKHIIQSKSVDLKQKLKLLFIDLLTVGQCYYTVKLGRKGETPKINIENPFDVFILKDESENKVNKSVRSVVRRWKTKQQIMVDYGRWLKEEHIDILDHMFNTGNTSDVYYVRNCSGGIMANVGITLTNTNTNRDSQYKNTYMIPVYEVEWLSPNKFKNKNNETDYRMDRYEGVRIGESMYVNMGKSENVVRSIENPLDCKLSLNGITFDDRSDRPYSLMTITAPLQDKYNLLHFYRDVLIASSGTKGVFLDVSQLPSFLGTNETERIAKWNTYRKGGTALINSAEEGRQQAPNTVYTDFDDTVPGQAIEAIQFAIQATAETVSNITGVFRERLAGGIEQRDAVTNIKVGIKQSAIVTKQYHQLMDSITNDLLIDAVNMCKISYDEGMVGSVVLGNKLQKIFTIDPKKFSFTDYDIHIPESGQYAENMETIKAMAMSLVESNAVDVDVVLELITSESLTQAKENVQKSVEKKLKQNDQIEQASQTIQQLESQLKQIQSELQNASNENEQLKGRADALKQRELELDYEINKEKNRITEQNNKGKLEIEKERTELEKLQLLDNNPYNNKIKGVY